MHRDDLFRGQDRVRRSRLRHEVSRPHLSSMLEAGQDITSSGNHESRERDEEHASCPSPTLNTDRDAVGDEYGEYLQDETPEVEMGGRPGDEENCTEEEETDREECEADEACDIAGSHRLTWDWRTLWSTVMLTGTKTLTRKQFDSVRSLTDSVARQAVLFSIPSASPALLAKVKLRVSKLPHYCTIHKSRRPKLYKKLAVRCSDIEAVVNMRAGGAKKDKQNESGDVVTHLKVTLPSEFAREDLATPTIFEAMRASSLQFRSSDDAYCVDTIPVVQGKSWFYENPRSVSVDHSRVDSALPFAEPGDVVEINFVSRNAVTVDVSNAFSTLSFPEAETSTVIATLLHVWTVRHSCREHCANLTDFEDNELSDLERAIVNAYAFCSYESPSDCNSAIERANKWRTWSKPVLKPGDIVAMLRPTGPGDVYSGSHGYGPTDGESERVVSASRICVVFRFWVEPEEQDRHAFCVQNDTLVPLSPLLSTEHGSATRDDFADVSSIVLIGACRQARGPQQYSAISSFGKLLCGESYFIYRFYLYWDAFIVQESSQASAEGLYLTPLNIPPHLRRSQHAVRVCTLTPPGVKADAVFTKLADDLAKGCSEGFIDFDAEGGRRRIFLDLLGFLGDTPAVNDCLDVRGHNANSPCHQCRYRKYGAGLTVSHYASAVCNGAMTTSLRTALRHQAVRDCEPGQASLSLLGLASNPTPRKLCIQRLCDRLTRTVCLFDSADGRPVVETALDPFRACWIAPDHVLCGHLEDCLNLTFRLLPTRNLRRSVELMLLQLMRDSGMHVQARILNSTSMAVFKMPMSDLYSVGLLAPLAFRLGVTIAERESSQRANLSEAYQKSLKLLKSISTLIKNVFWMPNTSRDRTQDVSEFHRSHSVQHVSKLRAAVDAHLSLVREVCTPSRLSMMELNRTTTPVGRRREIREAHEHCVIAKKEVDKPNVHRLAELTGTTLHMFTCLTHIGELVLEKRHQVLKRATKRANNLNIHIHAMNTVVFNDWQSRLTMNLESAHKGHLYAQRACFRLLQGRDAVRQCAGKPSRADIAKTMAALTQLSPLCSELHTQNMTLAAPRAASCSPLSTFRPSQEDVFTPSSSSCQTLSNALRTAYPECALGPVWRTSIHFTRRCSATLNVVKRNTVLRTICPRSLLTADYTPFVHLATSTEPGQLCLHWITLDIASVKIGDGAWRHFARVLPVIDIRKGEDIMYMADSAADPRLLLLTSEIMPAAVIHDCMAGQCTSTIDPPGVAHSSPFSAIEGDCFFLLSRSDGYPARCG